jgi:hypothetical protein
MPSLKYEKEVNDMVKFSIFNKIVNSDFSLVDIRKIANCKTLERLVGFAILLQNIDCGNSLDYPNYPNEDQLAALTRYGFDVNTTFLHCVESNYGGVMYELRDDQIGDNTRELISLLKEYACQYEEDMNFMAEVDDDYECEDDLESDVVKDNIHNIIRKLLITLKIYIDEMFSILPITLTYDTRYINHHLFKNK